MEVVDILPSLEVLAVNLVAFDRCLARRRSLFGTVIPIFSFTVVFMLVAALFFNGAAFNVGEFSALGFLYFFPLRLLYVGRTKDILLSMCMTWTYSLGVLAVSVQAAMMMESFGMAVPVFVLEAVLFLATFFPFGTRLISRFSYILQNACTMQKARSVYFEASIVLNFLTLLVVHVAFADKQEYALQILAVLLILASNYFFYHVVYEIVSGSLRISALELETSIDVLTGLGNRAKAIDDVRALMREERAFSIVYLDLDRFKAVNDRFGHDMGDRYLRHFAKVFPKRLKERGASIGLAAMSSLRSVMACSTTGRSPRWPNAGAGMRAHRANSTGSASDSWRALLRMATRLGTMSSSVLTKGCTRTKPARRRAADRVRLVGGGSRCLRDQIIGPPPISLLEKKTMRRINARSVKRVSKLTFCSMQAP